MSSASVIPLEIPVAITIAVALTVRILPLLAVELY
jgi:hypothetical protein